jgi:hypothetical protein
MKDQEHDIMSIKNYLLGALPDGETEKLDELSVADDDFAETLKQVEHDLIDAYANGELEGRDLAKFESCYLASPRRRERFHIAEALKEVSDKHLPERAASKAAVVEREPRRSFFGGLFSPALQWGFASLILVLAATTFWLWINNRQLRQQAELVASDDNIARQRIANLEQQIGSLRSEGNQANLDVASAVAERDRLQQELDQTHAQSEQNQKESANKQTSTSGAAPTVTASFVLTPSLRGSNQLQRLSIPENTTRVALRLDLEPNDFSGYTAEIKEPGTGRTIWHSGTIKANKHGDVSSIGISLPAKLLSAKVYTISLTGISPDDSKEPFSDYTFQVVR